jgi:hypothetical protein
MAVLYMAASLGLGLLAVAAGAVLATVVAPARKKAEAG